MKTTNQILASVCRERERLGPNRTDPFESERDLHWPFSRKSENGECDMATDGHALLAIFGRGAHYRFDQGAALGGVFLRSDGSFAPSVGIECRTTVKALSEACRNAPEKKDGVKLPKRMLRLVAAPQEEARDTLKRDDLPAWSKVETTTTGNVYVEAPLLLKVLEAMHRHADVSVWVGRELSAGKPSLEPVELRCSRPWDGLLGEVRALVMPVAFYGPVPENEYARFDVEPAK